MDTNDTNEVDLLAEMSQATEFKPEVTTQVITTPQNNDDFEPEPEPEPSPEAETESETNTINAEDLTELIIDGTDMAMEHLLPWLYRSTIAKDDLQTMNEIARMYRKAKDQKTAVLTFTEKQQDTMDLYIDYEDYCENLPLTKREKKNLRDPLRKLLSSIDFKATPGNALIAVALMILVPRLFQVAVRKFGLNK